MSSCSNKRALKLMSMILALNTFHPGHLQQLWKIAIFSQSLNVTLKFLFEFSGLMSSLFAFPFAFVHYIVCLMFVDVFYMNSLFLSVFSSVSSPYMWVNCCCKTLVLNRDLWYARRTADPPRSRRDASFTCACFINRAFSLLISLCSCFVFVWFFGIHIILSIWISQTLVCLCFTFF